jgi:hypothetical protein
MEYRTTGKGAATSNKIWNNAVNTLLSAMGNTIRDFFLADRANRTNVFI